MRLSIMSQRGFGPMPNLDPVIADAQDAERRGFAGMYMPHVFGVDTLSVMTAVALATERIELGTAVVPTYPRHPITMAQQALTVQTASQGRFNLGIGLSHKMVIEGMFGMSYEKPLRHMRNYLQILGPALRGEKIDLSGEQYSFHGALTFEVAPVPILVAALGEQMLRLTGQLAEGTLTWMVGPKTLESHTVPKLNQAATEHDRPQPRIVAGVPVHVTDNPEEARKEVQRRLELYGDIPSYRAMLDREGVEHAVEVALIGTESEVRAGIRRMRDIGVTEFCASPSDDRGKRGRTLDFLTGEL